ncbi:hypothetical protein NMY22_g20097 [Coprinellus aureogranulatus]|nr:hypothetical protein NMY22_g20097 [Coprinellus aureogranulatus]
MRTVECEIHRQPTSGDLTRIVYAPFSSDMSEREEERREGGGRSQEAEETNCSINLIGSSSLAISASNSVSVWKKSWVCRAPITATEIAVLGSLENRGRWVKVSGMTRRLALTQAYELCDCKSQTQLTSNNHDSIPDKHTSTAVLCE